MIPAVSDQPPPDPADKPISDTVSHAPVSARVPERIARGVFCTGQIVLDGPKEFIIDFLQGLTRPHQVVARVVMTPQTVAELIPALQKNIDLYTRNFGPPPPVPTPPQPPPDKRPSLQEIYENFRIPDEVLSGVYANSVLIGHSPTEFYFDFITAFFPTSAVAARVFLPAPQAPRFLTTLTSSFERHRDRMQPKPPPPPEQEQEPG